MNENPIITNLKFILSILGYCLIIIPIKRFIYPFLNFVLHEAYLFWFMLIAYIGLYLYDFDVSKLSNHLISKLLAENLPELTWFITPWFAIGFFEISPASLFLIGLASLFIIKLWKIVEITSRQIKQIAGDILLVVLWCYYTIAGKREQSVMLISSDEAKHKATMYLLIGLVIVLSVCAVVLPKLMTAHIMTVNMSAPVIMNNQSLFGDNQYILEWMIP